MIKAVTKKAVLLTLAAVLLALAAMAAPAALYTNTNESTEEKKFIKWVDFGVP